MPTAYDGPEIVATELEPGVWVAQRYRLRRQVGQGGMGVVWAARDETTGQRVALKVLQASLLGQDDVRRRFLAEARLASAIDHAAVVPIVALDELDDHTPVMVMELLDGETLAAVLRRRKLLEVAETLAIVRPVAGALRAAHDQGIVHRDLKPDNIFLVQDGAGATRPRVLDFGVAKLLDPRHAGSIVTKAGSTLGTPAYMAPEQAAADPSIDQRADIWSLGVVIYECLAGARPVEVSSIGQLLRRVATEAITPLGMLAPDAPAELTGLVMDMLAPDRDDRPADMAGICDVLDRL